MANYFLFFLLLVSTCSIYKTQMEDADVMHLIYGVCTLRILHHGLKNRHSYLLLELYTLCILYKCMTFSI